ncbi:uncharacterized protein [Dysidea avara]|uniref:uncharacterized protein isoform X2 n=1 Tax=Dysidea avara TaxID=196820 RepID=UPI0033188354
MGGDDWDPNEEYVTRCICGFTHDDGYMICCDGCSVWQHIECMQVDPNNVPDKYMCEHCEPRPTDKKRARLMQMKKREDISELEEEDDVSSDELHRVSRRKKRKVASSKQQPMVVEGKPQPANKRTKEDSKEPEKKKIRKRSVRTATALKAQPTTTNIQLEDTFMQDLWDISLSPWSDKYENIHQSRYTEQVKAIIALKSQQIKSEAISYSKEEYSSIEAKRPLAKFAVSEVRKRRRGIVTHTSLSMYELVMEYKGKFTLRNVVTAELGITGKFLWKSRPCPYVYCYEKIPGIDLCIDARQYGNLARFMRRSCTPNSELKHILINNELKIGVFASTSIKAGSEITLPFDFPYEQCDYPVDCACNQGMSCQVMRANFTIVNRMQLGRFLPVNDENHPYEDDNWSRSSTRSSEGLQQSSSSQLLQQRHWRNRDSSHSQSPPTTTSSLSTLLPESDSVDSDDDSVLMDHDTWSVSSLKKHKQHLCHEGRRKELTSKMLDGVEYRRGQQYNISPLHSSQLKIDSKKRFSGPQTAGHKVRLLPVTNKYHHQDSDGDLILSPPLLAPVPDHVLPSPPPVEMGFKVTPYLHPKFLIAKFPLPRKKVLLKKWKDEEINEKDHILNGSIHKSSGCELKGPLKKRWLKLYNHTGGSNGLSEIIVNSKKENHPLSLPCKKQALLKWKLTSPEQDTKQAVNEINLSTVVLSDGESCKDNLPGESMDVSSEDKKEGPASDVTVSSNDHILIEEEIGKEPEHAEDRNPTIDDNPNGESEPISEPTVTDAADTGLVDSEKPVSEKTTTDQDDVQVAAISSPKSPDPLVVPCDYNTSHDIDPRDVGDISSEKVTDQQQQPGDAKTSSGTDTPSQQGKRKKVSLLEYRNRARKSTDQQKSTDTPHSSGHSSPVSPNAPLLLLSNALTSLVSQMPASSLQSTLLGIGGSLSDNAISSFPEETVRENLTPLPQFEAISPGDSDNNWDTTPVHSQDEDSLGALPGGLALSSLMLGGSTNLSPYSPLPSQFHLHAQQWTMDDDKSHHTPSIEEQQKTTSRQNH